MIRRDGRPFYARNKKTFAVYLVHYNIIEARFEFEPQGNTRIIKKGFVSHYMDFPDDMEPTETWMQ